MKILMIGDVYGGPGRKALTKLLPNFVKQEGIDFVIANGENVTHGKSIVKKHYEYLKSLGIDVITSGNHIFKNKEVLSYIDKTKDLLRPLNMNSYLPGLGFTIQTINKVKIAVVNLLGTTFMNEKANNPYEVFDAWLAEKHEYDLLIVDFHAEATAEKMAFAWNYDGIVNLFVGTHTHVQTADERILPKGTVYLTDLGMTGAYNSIIGANPEEVIQKEKMGILSHFVPAKTGPLQMSGFMVYFDDQKQVTNFERVFLKYES
jgi:hypothetical protein